MNVCPAHGSPAGESTAMLDWFVYVTADDLSACQTCRIVAMRELAERTDPWCFEPLSERPEDGEL